MLNGRQGMEGTRLPKLQKPSGLKPPQIRTNNLEFFSENVISKTASNIPKSSKIKPRRSKSVTDLRSLGNKTKELPKFSAWKASEFKSKLPPLYENSINITPANVEPTSSSSTTSKLMARPRRSKSVTDLKLTGCKPKVISKPVNKNQNIKTNTTTVGNKRKAEKSSDEVKSKVIKQVKIPDWDYKGRFNQLREKHVAMNEQFKQQCDKLEELKTIEDEYISVKKECDHLKIILNKSEAKCKLLSDENEKLNTENKQLTDTVNNLNRDLLQLKEQHNSLNNDYNVMKIDFNKELNGNECLRQNLELETKKVIELLEQNSSLKKDVHNGDILRRKLHNTIQDLKGNIRVFCRVRPSLNLEEERLQCAINFSDEKTIEIRKSRESISAISGKPTDIKAEFTLDKVFEPKCSQEEIFEDLSQLVQSALDGYDVCVFAYGQTGSGKTYTMQGEETADKMGMIPRTVDLIFNSINKLRTAGWDYEICASFLEIYNENVRDLLNPNPSQNLEIRFNEGKGTTVTNLTIEKLNSAYELKNLMTLAQKNRAVAATDFNEHSSRSHAVTKIYLQGVNKEVNVLYTGSINLVDLAGSESAKTSSNERLLETKNINKSLSALGSVMLALYNKEKHIPYRNSKLTYLLQSCLGGNSKTLMVVNISPFEECYMESINSLRFAAKVKEVKMSAKRNKDCLISHLPNSKT